MAKSSRLVSVFHMENIYIYHGEQKQGAVWMQLSNDIDVNYYIFIFSMSAYL